MFFLVGIFKNTPGRVFHEPIGCKNCETKVLSSGNYRGGGTFTHYAVYLGILIVLDLRFHYIFLDYTKNISGRDNYCCYMYLLGKYAHTLLWIKLV